MGGLSLALIWRLMAGGLSEEIYSLLGQYHIANLGNYNYPWHNAHDSSNVGVLIWVADEIL
jgi:hypothetical protein